MAKKKLYLLIVVGDIEPEIHGPYKTAATSVNS